MFKLTRKADYAIRLMIDVGAQPGARIGTAEIATRQQIPYQFLRKVAQSLVAHGLLTAERGAGGGLSLARPAESISVLDVVSAIDVPCLNHCTIDPSQCDRRHVCAAYPVWSEVQREIERVLGGVRISDLVRRHRALSLTKAPGSTRDTPGDRSRAAHHGTAKGLEQRVQVARLRRLGHGLDSTVGSV